MLCLPQQSPLRALTRSKSLCREQSQSRQSSERCRSFPYNKADYRAYSPAHPPLDIVEEAGAFYMKKPLLSNESYHYKSDYHKQRHQRAVSDVSSPNESLLVSVSHHAGTDSEELVSKAARIVGSDDSNPGDSPLLCSSPHVDTDYDQPNNVARIVDADDLNLRELPSNTPNSSSDHDEAGNLARVVVLDPSGSNPCGFVTLEIDGHNEFDPEHHGTRDPSGSNLSGFDTVEIDGHYEFDPENHGTRDPSGSNPSGFFTVEIDGHNEFDSEQHGTRASSVKVFMLIGLEMLSAGFDQISSPSKPLNALISLLLAAMAVLTCIWELLDNVIKDRDASPNSMVFCTLPDFLGFGLAFIQFASSAVQYYFYHRHESNPVKLSLVSLFCLFWLFVLKWKN